MARIQQDDADLEITRWDFESGAVTESHEHTCPYFVVMLVAGTLRVSKLAANAITVPRAMRRRSTTAPFPSNPAKLQVF